MADRKISASGANLRSKWRNWGRGFVPRAWLTCGITAIAAAQVAQEKDTRPMLSFDAPEEMAGIKTSGASARRIKRGTPEGGYGLEVRFEPVENAQVQIPVHAGDWRGYGSLVLDAKNTSAEPVMFSIEARDQAGAATAGRTWWALASGEQASFFAAPECAASG